MLQKSLVTTLSGLTNTDSFVIARGVYPCSNFNFIQPVLFGLTMVQVPLYNNLGTIFNKNAKILSYTERGAWLRM